MGGVIDLAASRDVAHPHFGINFGKVLATAILGLQVYGLEQQGGAGVFLNPTNLAGIVQGITSIWVNPPAQ